MKGKHLSHTGEALTSNVIGVELIVQKHGGFKIIGSTCGKININLTAIGRSVPTFFSEDRAAREAPAGGVKQRGVAKHREASREL